LTNNKKYVIIITENKRKRYIIMSILGVAMASAIIIVMLPIGVYSILTIIDELKDLTKKEKEKR
jgi:hypothetical protein